MKTLPVCLGLVQASEHELVNAFGMMADRHSRDFEIHQGCTLFAQWSQAHLETLAPFVERHGRIANSDPARVRSALFHGMRIGGYGLLRDLQDLLLLVHQANSAWTALAQAAKELKATDMAETAARCGAEIDRQIDWLCTHIKLAAPQTLTVPAAAGDELKGSMPKKPTPASLPEIAWSPIAAGFGVLTVGAAGLLAGQPWLLPSLGPTAYLIAEMPEHPSARLYNTIVGHLIGLGADFLGVVIFNAWSDPAVLTGHVLTASRLGAAAVAITLTLLMAGLLKASHPPAAATALLVSLGSLQTLAGAGRLMAGALVIGSVGIAVRMLRTRAATPIVEEHRAEVLSASLKPIRAGSRH